LQNTRTHVSIVVLSCDKYKDLWDPFFNLFFKFWPRCEFPVYLFSNTKVYKNDRVQTILSGEDQDWSSSIKKCLKQIDSEYVWVFFDDVFLTEHVECSKISRLLSFLESHNPNYLRFRVYPRPDKKHSDFFGICGEEALYRTSIFSIWKKQIFMNLLIDGETAWQFESESIERASKYSRFYGVYENYLTYEHGVERGLWIRSAYKKLTKLGVYVDIKSRPLMSNQQHLRHLFLKAKTFIFDRSPNNLKPYLYLMSSFARKIVKN